MKNLLEQILQVLVKLLLLKMEEPYKHVHHINLVKILQKCLIYIILMKNKKKN